MIKVALIEDNRLVREGLAALLNTTPDLRVVAEAATVDPDVLLRTPPEIILLDVGLADDDSLLATRQVRSSLPDVKIIIMDLMPLHDDIAEFVKAGVAGVIHKEATVSELLDTIREVASGRRVLPEVLPTSLLSEVARAPVAKEADLVAESMKMSEREQRVIDLLGQGKSYEQVALMLSLPVRTVKTDVRNVMEKLDLRTRLD